MKPPSLSAPRSSERATRVRSPLASRSVITSGVCSTIRPVKTRPSLVATIVRLVLLAHDTGGVDQADEQEIAIAPVRERQVGTDRLSLAMESVAVGTAVMEELSSPRGVARGGSQVVVEAADLGEPLLARGSAGHPPVLAYQGRRAPVPAASRTARAGRASPRRPIIRRDRSQPDRHAPMRLDSKAVPAPGSARPRPRRG